MNNSFERQIVDIITNEGLSQPKRMVQLYELGFSISETAKLMGVIYQNARNVLSEHARISGTELRANQPTDQIRSALVNSIVNGECGETGSAVFIYPGTFDPLTSGHIDIILRASRIADRLVVAVLRNVKKSGLFTPEQRLLHIKAVTDRLGNTEAVLYDGLQVGLLQKYGGVLIRGVRGAPDLDQEMAMVYGNRTMTKGAETLFIPADPRFAYISSSLVREISSFGGNVGGMVPPHVNEALRGIYANNMEV